MEVSMDSEMIEATAAKRSRWSARWPAVEDAVEVVEIVAEGAAVEH